MPQAIGPVAERYGRLRPLEYVWGRGWKCDCDCGKTVIVTGGNLRRGNVVSCGCYRSDAARDRSAKNIEKLKATNTPWGWAKANAFRWSKERVTGEILVRPMLLRRMTTGHPCWVCRRPTKNFLCVICSGGKRAKR